MDQSELVKLEGVVTEQVPCCPTLKVSVREILLVQLEQESFISGLREGGGEGEGE